MKTLKCPYCGGRMVAVQSRYGWQYMCNNMQFCDASVGCHPGTRKPLGTPANRVLKDARIKLHACFDPIWKDEGKTRKQAYKWLAEKLDVSSNHCHIGEFTLEQCEVAYLHCMQVRSSFNVKETP